MSDTVSFGSASKMRRPLIPAPARNPITLLLLWLSKTDPRLVAVCSRWAIATQAAFGVFVAFTATLAFGAAYYTLSTLNARPSLVPWIALAWAVFILFLDREIAGSLDKTTAIVRPFLALFIGALAAIPIELWVFEQRIDQELQREYRADNKQQLDTLRADQSLLLRAQEQGEALQFVDDLYEQKRSELRVDTRIFEEA